MPGGLPQELNQGGAFDHSSRSLSLSKDNGQLRVASFEPIVVPMIAYQKTIGRVSFLNIKSENLLEVDTLSFLEDLVKHAGLALANVSLLGRLKKQVSLKPPS